MKTLQVKITKIILMILVSIALVFSSSSAAYAVPTTTIPQAQTFNVPQFSPCGAFGCSPQNLAIVVGHVTAVSGMVRVMHPNGSVSILKVGDDVYVGEMIVTGVNAKVCVRTPENIDKCVGASQKYKF